MPFSPDVSGVPNLSGKSGASTSSLDGEPTKGVGNESGSQVDAIDEDLQQRQALASAYASVKGWEFTQSIAATTVEDFMVQHIEALSGSPGNSRRNVFDRVNATVEELRTTILQLKEKAAVKAALVGEVVTTPTSTTDAIAKLEDAVPSIGV
jgi:hypothetical protein